jgi:hypothetical protein
MSTGLTNCGILNHLMNISLKYKIVERVVSSKEYIGLRKTNVNYYIKSKDIAGRSGIINLNKPRHAAEALLERRF